MSWLSCFRRLRKGAFLLCLGPLFILLGCLQFYLKKPHLTPHSPPPRFFNSEPPTWVQIQSDRVKILQIHKKVPPPQNPSSHPSWETQILLGFFFPSPDTSVSPPSVSPYLPLSCPLSLLPYSLPPTTVPWGWKHTLCCPFLGSRGVFLKLCFLHWSSRESG